MKKIITLIVTITMIAMFAGCARDNDTTTPPKKGDFNEFGFTTSSTTTLAVDYGAMGGTPSNVYFEVYDTSPVLPNQSGTGYVKVAGVEPLYAGYTDDKGRFNGTLELPSYVEKAYVYTPAFYAQTLLEAVRSGDVLTAAVEPDTEEMTTAGATRATHSSTAIDVYGWKAWLGDYDTTYGTIGYAYEGDLKVKNYAALLKAHASVFDTTKSCPEEYRSSRDLYLEKTAEVAITFLGGNTCWNSSMGYYFYKSDNKPKSLAEANVVMLFPNTQDGEWSNDRKTAKKYKGISRGTAVRLIYYPEIANGSKAGATTIFPEGYRIGFVLATNAWTNRLPNFMVNKNYCAATSDGLSVNNNGVAYQSPRTAVFRYTDAANDINSILFSFEDHINDDNFCDVVFTMISNPVDAVTDIPSVDVTDDKKTVKTLKGIYTFEDLWPSRGDYDMNDVMVRSEYEKVFNEKGIYEESFQLKTYANYAGNTNGLAVMLTGGSASAELEFSMQLPGSNTFETADFERDGNIVLLTSDVKEYMGAAFRITAKYNSPIAPDRAGVAKPFIYRTSRDGVSEGKRWEVHIPYEAPTALAEMSFFGTNDDKSIPERGIYYVRAENYPFAFFLAGATDGDVAKLLDPNNEKKRVDQLYSGYAGWVTSSGKENADWYKK